MNRPRTFLTGASGYLGTHVLAGLVAGGHDVTAVVRRPERLGPLAHHPRVTVLATDLEDAPRVAAALAGHHRGVHAALIWGEPGTELEFRDTAAAAKLFDAAGRVGVRRCVYVSSAAVHRPFSAEMAEDDALTTTDLYGATKAAGELVLRAACATHGMEGVVVRPGPIVGPPAFDGGALRSDNRLVAMVAAARAGAPVRVTRGDGRQLAAVDDVTRTIVRLLTIDAPLPTYLCMDRALTSWEAVARVVVEVAGTGSDVTVEEPVDRAPAPRFRVDRLEALLGGPTDAREALGAQVRALLAR